MSDEVKVPTIEEGKMNEVPRFYESLANNPVKEITGGAKKIYSDYIVLKKVESITLNVPELSGITPGYDSVTRKHGIGSGEIFGFYYVTSDLGGGFTGIVGGESPYFNGFINIGAVKVQGENYTVEAWNQNIGLGVQTLVLQVYLYQLKTK